MSASELLGYVVCGVIGAGFAVMLAKALEWLVYGRNPLDVEGRFHG